MLSKTYQYSLIACKNLKNVIGHDNHLLYSLKEDMKFFKTMTTQPRTAQSKNVVVMGRKTWDSIPSKYRPLSERINVICSRQMLFSNESLREQDSLILRDPTTLETTLQEAYPEISSFFIYIIGGGDIYQTFLPLCDTLYLTRVFDRQEPSNATYLPSIPYQQYRETEVSEIKEQDSLLFQMATWKKKQEFQEETDYLHLLTNVLTLGNERTTRNGITYSKFGVSLEYSLRNNVLPLLTTKKVYLRGVIQELLWFVKGRTDSKELERKRVNIWKGNSSREYLDSIELTDYPEGTCGPIYGFQWRHFNAPYQGPDADYTDCGVDQLGECLRLLKENPMSRRIFMSAWNPEQMKKMCLPCCHVSYQWYVSDGELHCQMYQRSGDLFLGIPFNIASTSLLTIMLAHLSGYKPGSVRLCIGDAHVYENHYEAVLKQIKRTPYPFPTISIEDDPKTLEDFTYRSFKIHNYKSHKTIKASMNV